ncbi:MAG: serine/threonine protein kinase [Tannerellaceae bacterium]|jgi:serine/threonine protein kinase|nr:serine/threonine protein kinase [Tannerellaceae bacterium]
MADLQKGDKFETKDGRTVTVLEKLGKEGGQGAVYEIDHNGKHKALKWYHKRYVENLKAPRKFYENLDNNIKRGAPTDSFLWPQDILKNEESFGYVMDLRPPEYKDFTHFLLAKEKFASVTAMLNAALNITAGFRELHNKGYSYQDLNDGNFFINPKSGAVLICDNDNVSEFGKSSGIAGKARYMAPEIVVGKASPGTKTDSFSLAVVLFLLFINDHPLEGKKTCVPCMTEELEKKFYGKEPVFIYDPEDTSNRPEPGIHRNALKRWERYPVCLREMFQKAFSKQVLSDPSYRVLEIDWLRLFIRLRAEIFKCSCGEVFFADAVESTSCPRCGKNHKFNLCIKTSRYIVPVHQRTRLYSCHIESGSNDFSTPAGEIVLRGDAFSLKNVSLKTWIVSDGTKKDTVAPDSLALLRKGITIDFGGESAQVI